MMENNEIHWKRAFGGSKMLQSFHRSLSAKRKDYIGFIDSFKTGRNVVVARVLVQASVFLFFFGFLAKDLVRITKNTLKML